MLLTRDIGVRKEVRKVENYTSNQKFTHEGQHL